MNPDLKYWKKIAAFSYASYLEKGCGAVLIKENAAQQFSSAELDKYFKYIPYLPDEQYHPPTI